MAECDPIQFVDPPRTTRWFGVQKGGISRAKSASVSDRLLRLRVEKLERKISRDEKSSPVERAKLRRVASVVGVGVHVGNVINQRFLSCRRSVHSDRWDRQVKTLRPSAKKRIADVTRKKWTFLSATGKTLSIPLKCPPNLNTNFRWRQALINEENEKNWKKYFFFIDRNIQSARQRSTYLPAAAVRTVVEFGPTHKRSFTHWSKMTSLLG